MVGAARSLQSRLDLSFELGVDRRPAKPLALSTGSRQASRLSLLRIERRSVSPHVPQKVGSLNPHKRDMCGAAKSTFHSLQCLIVWAYESRIRGPVIMRRQFLHLATGTSALAGQIAIRRKAATEPVEVSDRP